VWAYTALSPEVSGSDDARFAEPRVERVGENEYEVYVIAQQFLFRPQEIQVPAMEESTAPSGS